MRYVPGVKISGCTSYIYTWVEIIIDAERSLGYSVYTIKSFPLRILHFYTSYLRSFKRRRSASVHSACSSIMRFNVFGGKVSAGE